MDLSFNDVGSQLLNQGVTFLYDQAGELLRRRREARERLRVQSEETEQALAELPTLLPPGGVFLGPSVETPVADTVALDRLADDLIAARQGVEGYVLGSPDVDRLSPSFAGAVDQIRRLVEEIYGTTLTFAGEKRSDPEGRQVSARSIGVYVEGSVTNSQIAGRDLHGGR